MMGRLNRDQGQLLYCFDLDEIFTEDHLGACDRRRPRPAHSGTAQMDKERGRLRVCLSMRSALAMA